MRNKLHLLRTSQFYLLKIVVKIRVPENNELHFFIFIDLVNRKIRFLFSLRKMKDINSSIY